MNYRTSTPSKQGTFRNYQEQTMNRPVRAPGLHPSGISREPYFRTRPGKAVPHQPLSTCHTVTMRRMPLRQFQGRPTAIQHIQVCFFYGDFSRLMILRAFDGNRNRAPPEVLDRAQGAQASQAAAGRSRCGVAEFTGQRRFRLLPGSALHHVLVCLYIGNTLRARRPSWRRSSPSRRHGR
jgi:hypothetical protein